MLLCKELLECIKLIRRKNPLFTYKRNIWI